MLVIKQLFQHSGLSIMTALCSLFCMSTSHSVLFLCHPDCMPPIAMFASHAWAMRFQVLSFLQETHREIKREMPRVSMVRSILLYFTPAFFLSCTASTPHCPLTVLTCNFHIFSIGCANQYLSVPSCVLAMLTYVQLCFWQPIAFLSLASCSTNSLSKAICTFVYKP